MWSQLILTTILALGAVTGAPAPGRRDRALAALEHGLARDAEMLSREGLAADPGAPYRWLEFAQAQVELGNRGLANAAASGAAGRFTGIPALHAGLATVYWRTGQTSEAARHGGLAMAGAGFEAAVLQTWREGRVPVETALASLPKERRIVRAAFETLDGGDPLASPIENWAAENGLMNAELAAIRVDRLLAAGEHEAAARCWRRHGDYEAGNLVGNGGFERAPAGAGFDWTLPQDASLTAEAPREGKQALMLRWTGDAPPPLTQRIWIPGGRHELAAWVRSDTRPAPPLRLRLSGPGMPDAVTDLLDRPSEWRRLTAAFTAPPRGTLATLSLTNGPWRRVERGGEQRAALDGVSIRSKEGR